MVNKLVSSTKFMSSKNSSLLIAVAVIIILAAAVFFAFYKAPKSVGTAANTSSTSIPSNSNSGGYTQSNASQNATVQNGTQSVVNLGEYVKVYVGHSQNFSLGSQQGSISLDGISGDSSSQVAAMTLSFQQMKIGNIRVGQHQYLSISGSNSAPYIEVQQIYVNNTDSSKNWAIIALSMSISSGFSQVNTSSSSNTGSLSNPTISGAPVALPACGASNTILSQLPISIGNFSSVVPLGWTSPGGHVIPSDHIYFQIPSDPSLQTPNTTVVSPGNIIIYRVDAKTYHSSGPNGNTHDYSIYFASCENVTFFIHHLESAVPLITSNLTSSALEGQCVNATENLDTITTCQYSTKIAFKTGQKLGTIGGFSGAAEAMDLGANDYSKPELVYANASKYSSDRLHAACPIDYFPASIQQELYSKLGMFGVSRTVLPLCGINDQDVIGSAQGNWFIKGTSAPYTNEGDAVALIHDNILPNIEMFSIGNLAAIPGVGAVIDYFVPQNSGFINRNFSGVTADGHVYCYSSLMNSFEANYSSPVAGRFLVQMLNANSMQIEFQNQSSCNGNFAFTAGHATIYR